MHMDFSTLRVPAAVTRQPTDAWLAQQLREATPFGAAPKHLICDNDNKFGARFVMVAEGAGIEILKTPFHAPRANAYCERFLGSVRRECLDHVILFGARHLHWVIREYVQYFNSQRPHQGLGQQIPAVLPLVHVGQPPTSLRVCRQPVLGGLHHHYRLAA